MLLTDPFFLSLCLLLASIHGIVLSLEQWWLERENRRLQWAVYLARCKAWETEREACDLRNQALELYQTTEDLSDTNDALINELQMARALIRQGRTSAGAERLDYVIDRLRRTQEELEAA